MATWWYDNSCGWSHLLIVKPPVHCLWMCVLLASMVELSSNLTPAFSSFLNHCTSVCIRRIFRIGILTEGEALPSNPRWFELMTGFSWVSKRRYLHQQSYVQEAHPHYLLWFIMFFVLQHIQSKPSEGERHSLKHPLEDWWSNSILWRRTS